MLSAIVWNEITSTYKIDWFSWKLAAEGYIKLNIDGNYKASSHLVIAGGVLRICQGVWLARFVVNLGSTICIKTCSSHAFQQSAY